MNNIVVVSRDTHVDQLSDLGKDVEVITAEDYLKNQYEKNGVKRIFNLCNDYSYCKKGYYVSLLAEARGHRPFPDVSMLTDTQNISVLQTLLNSMNDPINKALKDIKADKFEISIYFGNNMASRYKPIARQIFNYIQAPLMRVHCIRKKAKWRVKSLKLISFKDIPSSHHDFLIAAMKEFFGSKRSLQKAKLTNYRYDLGIMINEKEEIPPSDKGALENFISAAKEYRINAELVTAKDLGILTRFDGLFIRETTNVFDHTYKIAKSAELAGLVVIDDPNSILRCCNKVYLHDMLTKKKLSTPATQIIYKDTDLTQFNNYPLVIKIPDSAFSYGVKKVNSLEELQDQARAYFMKSDLLLVQEFLQTDFDWRIGFIDGEPLYACRYHMAEGHWQIINRTEKGLCEGGSETLSLSEVPEKAIRLASKACKEIGNGFYGVDIKEKDGRFFLIEVNDNPSIEKGIEDKVLGPQLYLRVMASFLRRFEAR